MQQNYSYNATKKYQTILEDTSTRKTLQVVMLYDAIIMFLNRTKEAIEHKNLQDRYNNTDKALKIIEGLQACLDVEKGKDIAKTMDKFYISMFLRIVDLNFNNDSMKCTQIIDEMKAMREAWHQVDLEMSTKEEKNETIDFNKICNNLPKGSNGLAISI